LITFHFHFIIFLHATISPAAITAAAIIFFISASSRYSPLARS
jgi:hypothetical protein